MTSKRSAFAVSLAAVSVVLSAFALGGCAQQHATVADCVSWMTQQLEARGTDSTLVTADIQRQCIRNKATMTEAEFDRFKQ